MYATLTDAAATPMTICAEDGAATDRELATNLADCDLRFADLSRADFSGAKMTKADLRAATRDETRFTGAALDGALVTASTD